MSGTVRRGGFARPIAAHGPAAHRPGAHGPAACRLVACALVGLLSLGCGDDGRADEPAAFSAVATVGSTEGRSVWVRVLDRDAKPIPGARVFAQGGEDLLVAAERVEPGEHRIDGLGEGRVRILVDVAGQRHMLEHPSSNPRATLVLPVGGGLEVAWAVPKLAALPDGTLHLVVATRADPDLRLELEVARNDRGSGTLAIPYLPVGEYLASLELWRKTTPMDTDDPEDPAKVLPLTAPRALWIEPRTVTQVVLGEPQPPSSDAS